MLLDHMNISRNEDCNQLDVCMNGIESGKIEKYTME